jgi:hypothetical protein
VRLIGTSCLNGSQPLYPQFRTTGVFIQLICCLLSQREHKARTEEGEIRSESRDGYILKSRARRVKRLLQSLALHFTAHPCSTNASNASQLLNWWSSNQVLNSGDSALFVEREQPICNRKKSKLHWKRETPEIKRHFRLNSKILLLNVFIALNQFAIIQHIFFILRLSDASGLLIWKLYAPCYKFSHINYTRQPKHWANKNSIGQWRLKQSTAAHIIRDGGGWLMLADHFWKGPKQTFGRW